MPYVIFDIETRIDKEAIARCEGPSTAEQDVNLFWTIYAQGLREKQGLADTEQPWVPWQYHRTIAIAAAFVSDDYKLGAVESLDGDEQGLVSSFWARAERFQEKFRGVLVSFNGRRFDFPVLELAALRFGIAAPGHFGKKYGNRYRYQADHHLDLHDYVGNGGAVRAPGLNALAVMLGLPGKGGMDGGDVQALWEANQLDRIRAYNRNDVRMTYLLFAAVQKMRGLAVAGFKAPELEFEQ